MPAFWGTQIAASDPPSIWVITPQSQITRSHRVLWRGIRATKFWLALARRRSRRANARQHFLTYCLVVYLPCMLCLCVLAIAREARNYHRLGPASRASTQHQIWIWTLRGPSRTRLWINVGSTLVQRRRRWTNVKPTLIRGPTLNQHWFNVLCLFGLWLYSSGIGTRWTSTEPALDQDGVLRSGRAAGIWASAPRGQWGTRWTSSLG